MSSADARKPLYLQWTFPYRIVRSSIAASLSRCVDYAGGVLLDVGCGNRPWQHLFARHVSAYIGVDIAGTPDIVASAVALPIKGASCGTVLMTEVLEHIPEPLTALQEVHRILRTGGHLVVTVPQWWPLHEEPADYYRFTQHGLAYLLSEAGLSLVELHPRGNSCLCGAQRVCDHLCRAADWPSGLGRIRRILLELLCAFIQALGYVGAELLPDSRDVLGWTAVARKE